MENKTMALDGWINRWVVAPDTLTHNTQKQSFPLPHPPNKSPTLVADSKSHNPKQRTKKRPERKNKKEKKPRRPNKKNKKKRIRRRREEESQNTLKRG
jgi:hypothetical protein